VGGPLPVPPQTPLPVPVGLPSAGRLPTLRVGFNSRSQILSPAPIPRKLHSLSYTKFLDRKNKGEIKISSAIDQANI